MSELRLQSLRKAYGAVTALDDVSLAVPQGQRLAVVGPSGSGKTTLLRLIAGFDSPDRGSIHLGADCLADDAAMVPAHLRGIGIVAQDGALFPHLSIAGNIGFGLPRSMHGRDAAILQLLDMVGLDRAMLERRPDQLSGGQQQRVALARALARKPRLMLLDEPFSALDTALRASTRKAVADLLQERGITTVLVTHDQGEALSFADVVAVMQEGRLLQAGSPRELYYRPSTPLIAEFMGDAVILEADCRDGYADSALGRIPLNDPDFHGRCKVLLRPEQIVLAVSGAVGSVLARVEQIEFGGASSLITLRLEPIAGHPQATPLVLRRSDPCELASGGLVALAVRGKAHPFPRKR
jgi:iron(III) transport system ATP-binding protein